MLAVRGEVGGAEGGGRKAALKAKSDLVGCCEPVTLTLTLCA